MAGEKSVLSGEAGQTITKKLLELCGWQIAEHIDFGCCDGEKHKSQNSKGGRMQHSIDAIQCYNSPLNHSAKKLVCISSKHHIEEYPKASISKLNRTAKELAQSINCAKDSPEIAENCIFEDQQDRPIEFDGLITFFSSAPEEKHVSFFNANAHELSIPTDDFNALFFIDNKRATFLYSAIKEAQNYSDDRTMSFVYPDTGANDEAEKMALNGHVLPLELMCSDVLPILVKKEDNYHVLIFCNDKIESKYLKRIIWLVHRICGFASKTMVYFPDYDPSLHDSMINLAKQAFQESDYVRKIGIKKWDDLSFIRLKETSVEHQPATKISGLFPNHEEIISLRKVKISEDYDKVLPFGSMIKPILSSSVLMSASTLKDFLKRKGIFVKYADKELLIPIFANLILSPNELDYLKGLLMNKEETTKSTNKNSIFLGTEKLLREVLLSILPQSINLKPNCKHLKAPKFVSKGNDRYELEIEIERNNTTKDLISGKTHHTGCLTVLLENGMVNVKTEFTSFEVKTYLDNAATAVNVKLKEAGCIQQDLRSVKFGDFATNEDRVEFLTSFQNIDYSDHFNGGEIVNIKFKPDEDIKDLPNELKSYRGKVKNLDINGNLLEQLPHIKNQDYKNAILLSRVKVKYKFSVDGNQGFCIAEIGFPSTLNGNKVDRTTDLVVSVEIFKTKGDNITGNIPRLQNRLSRILDQIVLSKYNHAYDVYAADLSGSLAK